MLNAHAVLNADGLTLHPTWEEAYKYATSHGGNIIAQDPMGPDYDPEEFVEPDPLRDIEVALVEGDVDVKDVLKLMDPDDVFEWVSDVGYLADWAPVVETAVRIHDSLNQVRFPDTDEIRDWIKDHVEFDTDALRQDILDEIEEEGIITPRKLMTIIGSFEIEGIDEAARDIHEEFDRIYTDAQEILYSYE